MRLDPITADFMNVRWLGDRKEIAKETKTWDKTIVNRTRDLKEWAEILWKVHERRDRRLDRCRCRNGRIGDFPLNTAQGMTAEITCPVCALIGSCGVTLE